MVILRTLLFKLAEMSFFKNKTVNYRKGIHFPSMVLVLGNHLSENLEEFILSQRGSASADEPLSPEPKTDPRELITIPQFCYPSFPPDKV